MSLDLTEEEMRRALFGAVDPKPCPAVAEHRFVQTANELSLSAGPASKPEAPRKAKSKSPSPKLRVTLHVTKEYEGQLEVFVHEASTLSTILAEQEARKAAQKKRFKYFNLISIKPIS